MSITGEKSSYPLDSSDVFSCYSQGQVDTKYVQSCKGYLVDNKVTKLDRRKLLSTLFEVSNGCKTVQRFVNCPSLHSHLFSICENFPLIQSAKLCIHMQIFFINCLLKDGIIFINTPIHCAVVQSVKYLCTRLSNSD